MTVDDTARGMPITPATAAAVTLDMLNRTGPPPMATCPTDGEPLIMTFEHAGAEFLCMECGRWFGFLAPTPAVETPELTARYEALRARFDAGERP